MKENKRFNKLPFDVFLLPEWNVFKEKLFLTILAIDAKIFFMSVKIILVLSENLWK